MRTRAVELIEVRLSIELVHGVLALLLLVWLVCSPCCCLPDAKDLRRAQDHRSRTTDGRLKPCGVAAGLGRAQAAFPVPWAGDDVDLPATATRFISLLSHSYMNVSDIHDRDWPDPSKVFALDIAGHDLPLLLIAILTMVLITSSDMLWR